MSATSILVYGHETGLLETRKWVLEKAGFAVHATTDFPQAIERVERQGPALLILCHTLSGRDREGVLSWTRARRPETKVLVLTTHLPVAQVGQGVEVLSAFIDPRVLLAAVERALGS
jgi:DNA-binding response OmpR family regulator